MQCLVNTADESELQPSCHSFCLIVKATCSLVALSSWKMRMHFLLTDSTLFMSSAAFSCSPWERYLLGSVIWFSRRNSYQRTPFQSHCVHSVTFFGWRPVPLRWLMVAHFACCATSSIPHHHTVSTFHHPPQFVLKTEHFFVTFSRVPWGNMVKVFPTPSCFAYVEPKHQSN